MTEKPEPKPVLTTTNSSEVSGTTTFDDGTKMYWTEGRSSWVRMIYPDGTSVHIPASELTEGWTDDPGPVIRAATQAEEKEWEETY